MASPQLSLGVQAVSAEMRTLLRTQSESTGFAAVRVEVDKYCTTNEDMATSLMFDAQPEIILVDMQDTEAAVKSLAILHSALPESWLFACAGSPDPKVMIEAMRAGAREFLPKRLSSRILAEAFSRYLDERQRRCAGEARGKLYSIMSAKGGAGATSVAINMATKAAALESTKVALVELNNMASDAAAYLNVKPRFTLTDALAAVERLDSVLLESLMTRVHGFSLLAGSQKRPNLSTAGTAALGKLLRVLSQTYSHCFVDLPSSLDESYLKVIAETNDALILVLTPELPALRRSEQLIALLGTLGFADRLRLIVNRDSVRDDVDPKQIQKALSHPVYWCLPNNYPTAIQAINQGEPIVVVNRSSLAAEYRNLTHDLTGIPLPAKRSGIFQLFSRAELPMSKSAFAGSGRG